MHLCGETATWRSAFLLPIGCSILELLVLPFCPESPAYLYRTEGSAVALSKLAELHSSKSIRGHMAWMRGERNVPLEHSLSVLELLKASSLRKPLFLSVMIQLSMEVWHRISSSPPTLSSASSSPRHSRCTLYRSAVLASSSTTRRSSYGRQPWMIRSSSPSSSAVFTSCRAQSLLRA